MAFPIFIPLFVDNLVVMIGMCIFSKVHCHPEIKHHIILLNRVSTSWLLEACNCASREEAVCCLIW